MARTGSLAVVVPELAALFPAEGEAPSYRYLAGLDRTPREAHKPEVLVGALFYHPICEAWAAADETPSHDVRIESANGSLEPTAANPHGSYCHRSNTTSAVPPDERQETMRMSAARRLARTSLEMCGTYAVTRLQPHWRAASAVIRASAASTPI